MSRKSVTTCFWFQKFYVIRKYVNVNVEPDTCRKYTVGVTLQQRSNELVKKKEKKENTRIS